MTLEKDDCVECPLCMESLEVDDLTFFPCACGYQVCRFCWHRLRTDGDGLCPACRQPYSENPADFTPLSAADMQRIKAEKRQRRPRGATGSAGTAAAGADSRKHLIDVRVVQRNLVFVVGLPPRLADSDVLRKNEYFGQFGKIRKILVSHPTQQATSQGQCASAHVTYCRADDALRAIRAVNNAVVDNKTLKVSLGTTKYCSLYLRYQTCSKGDCTFLHEPGDESASFTKEAMQQGKHQDYERRLLDQWSQQQQKRSQIAKDRVSVASGAVDAACGSGGGRAASDVDAAAARGAGGKKSRGRRGRRRQARAQSPDDAAGGRRPGTPEASSGDNATDDSQGRHTSESGRSSPLSIPDQSTAVAAAVAIAPAAADPAESSVCAPQLAVSATSATAGWTQAASVAESVLAGPPTPPPEQLQRHRTAECDGESVTAVVAAAASVSGFSSASADVLLGQPTPPPEPEDAEMPSAVSASTVSSSPAEQLLRLTATPVAVPTPPADDDLDFDPFEETTKGLSALMERERQMLGGGSVGGAGVFGGPGSLAARLASVSCAPPAGFGNAPQSGLVSRARLPPPGFAAPAAVHDPSIVAMGMPRRDNGGMDDSCLRFAAGFGGTSSVMSMPPPPSADRFLTASPSGSSLLAHRCPSVPPPLPPTAAPDPLSWDWSARRLGHHHPLQQPPRRVAGLMPGWPSGPGLSAVSTGSQWPPSQQQRLSHQPPVPTTAPVTPPQLPRADSPPHWLRALEQLTETPPPPPPPGLWSSVPPPRPPRIAEYF